MAGAKAPHDHLSKRVRTFFGYLGPGLITGAADDDPSGISTYSVTGATFGLGQLWTVFLTFPLMASVQIMCARLGLVCGEGLSATIRRHYSRSVLWAASILLIIANVVNIGADFAGMGEALQMVTGINSAVWIPILAIGILLAIVYWSYRHIVRTFKWLTLVLFSYAVTAFIAHPNWSSVLKATFVPHIEWTPEYLMTLVGILGTTITPYMFFWQAAQEVEEEREHGHKTLASRRGATAAELREAQNDVLFGMGWAGLAMYFIILTTATTLHKSGVQNVESAQQAAEALRPLAGSGAYLLFMLGIVGTGILAVPVLAGSAAYAVAEALHWHGSLNDKPRVGKKFYWIVFIAVAAGVLLTMLKVNAIRALFYAAVVNGLLAPPLVFILTHLTSDPKVMGQNVNPPIVKGLGYLTAIIMLLAAVSLVVTSLQAGS